MSIIDTTTGHSPRQEKKVARILYICIAVAVIAGLALILMVGQSKHLSPFKSSDPLNKEAPVESP